MMIDEIKDLGCINYLDSYLDNNNFNAENDLD